MALQNIGPIAGIELGIVQLYETGEYVFGPQMIPPGYSAIVVLIDLRQVGSLTVNIFQEREYSFDGGVTWNALGGLSGFLADKSDSVLVDGQLFNKDGGPLNSGGYYSALPHPEAERLVRVTMTVNEPVITGITLGVW